MFELPNGWRRVALCDATSEHAEKVGTSREITVLSSTKHHGLVPSDEYFKNRTIYSSDLSGYKLVRRDWFAYATNHLAEGSIGLQNEFSVACVSPIYTVFSCHDDVYPPYMFRLLKSPELLTQYGVHEQASVDRRGAVRYRDFGKIKINLPPKSEQQRIANILDAIDGQINNSSATLRVLKQIETGLSEYLLGWCPGQDPPPGWHMHTFDEIAAAPICYGIVQAGPNYEGGIPVAMIRDLEAKLSGNLHRTRPSIEAAYSRSRVREGDLLVSIKGTIGRICVVPEGFRGNISRDVARVRLTAHALPSFVAWLLSTKSGKELLESAVVGTTRSEVSIGILKKLPLPLPDIREQQKTLEIVSAVGGRIDVEQRRRRKFEIFKQGLMGDLLTGRVRVSDAEVVLENL